MSIINVKKTNLKKLGYSDFQEWIQDNNHIYIGRNMSFYVPGTTQSKWANPYSAKKYGRKECLLLYREYLNQSPHLLSCLPELKGKTLGCWCKPSACHGDILLELANQ